MMRFTVLSALVLSLPLLTCGATAEAPPTPDRPARERGRTYSVSTYAQVAPGLASSLLLFQAPTDDTVPVLKMPEEVKTPKGRLASITIRWQGKEVKWDASPELDVFREYDPSAEVVRLRVIGYTEGRYRVIAVASGSTGKLTDFHECKVIVGKPPAPPDPPDPPGPDPSPLTKKLQSAYAAEADPVKVTLLAGLVSLYGEAVGASADASITTWGGLYGALRARANALGVSGKLPIVQGAIAEVLTSALPTDPAAPLDASGRALAAKTFGEVLTALKGVKP